MIDTEKDAYVCAHCINYLECVKKRCAGAPCKKFKDAVHDAPVDKEGGACPGCQEGFID